MNYEDFIAANKWIGKFVGRILAVIVVIILLVILKNNFPLGTVGAGQRGVLLRFNAVTGKIFDEGLYWRWPFIERVIKVDIKIQKEQVEAAAASKDLQTVHSIVAMNFHIDKDKVAKLYQEIGVDYKERIIDPVIQESVKAVTAMFTAEELITKREIVKEDIKNLLKEKLPVRGINIDEFNIVNFEFSKNFNEAIEFKVTAEQEALAAKNKLERVKFEAQQRVAEAEGKAKAIRIEASALIENPKILQLRAIEKWDGILPKVTSGNIPFINIKTGE